MEKLVPVNEIIGFLSSMESDIRFQIRVTETEILPLDRDEVLKFLAKLKVQFDLVRDAVAQLITAHASSQRAVNQFTPGNRSGNSKSLFFSSSEQFKTGERYSRPKPPEPTWEEEDPLDDPTSASLKSKKARRDGFLEGNAPVKEDIKVRLSAERLSKGDDVYLPDRDDEASLSIPTGLRSTVKRTPIAQDNHEPKQETKACSVRKTRFPATALVLNEDANEKKTGTSSAQKTRYKSTPASTAKEDDDDSDDDDNEDEEEDDDDGSTASQQDDQDGDDSSQSATQDRTKSTRRQDKKPITRRRDKSSQSGAPSFTAAENLFISNWCHEKKSGGKALVTAFLAKFPSTKMVGTQITKRFGNVSIKIREQQEQDE